MNARSLGWVADALGRAEAGLLLATRLQGREDREWRGAVVDSRADCAGRLFFALRGERVDGHEYASQAYDSGCVAVVVEDDSTCPELEARGAPYFLVRDTAGALQELARAYRSQLDVRVVAITGSAGKTTTKEYTRRVLKSRYRVFANPGNYNSTIGVPVTILETDGDNEYLVCEVGANRPGEVDFLTGMLRPEIGVITNVGDAHVGEFGSVENIAAAKAELLTRLQARGWAVLPCDDDWYDYLARRNPARTVTFGRSADADFAVSGLERRAGGGLSFRVNDEPVELSAVGEYNALNACAAFAVGDVCGVEHAQIREALAVETPLPGRGRVHEVAGVTVVDESYNASPASMNASITTLESLPGSRRLAVLGDMKELGGFSADRHRTLGERLAAAALDAVFWLGGEASIVRAGYEAAGGSAPFEAPGSLGELTDAVARVAGEGDVVLVKASRAVRLDEFVAQLLERLRSRTEN